MTPTLPTAICRVISSPPCEPLKRAYTNHRLAGPFVLSPDRKLPGAMRLKESRKIPMWNGPIECRLFRFNLVAGSARPEAESATQPAA